MSSADREGLPTAAAPPRVPFTFILQDLRSVRDRRIQDPKHRHEIRSHVMRYVRLQEFKQGVKRPMGRGRARRTDRATNIDNAAAVKAVQQMLCRPAPATHVKKRSCFAMAEAYAFPLHVSPVASYGLDRFCETPQNPLSETAIRLLLDYACTHFVPMTFPVENKRVNQQEARRIVQRALKASPAGFYAFLATIACHRAVMHQRHAELGIDGPLRNYDRIRDSEFILAYRRSIGKTNVAMDSMVDAEYLEACFGIISTCMLVGDFDVARQYLNSIWNVGDHIDVATEANAWLPIIDIKVAVGLLSRPLVPLLWPRLPMNSISIYHKLLPSSKPLSLMGSAFSAMPDLSPELQGLLCDATVICLMCDFNACNLECLTDREHYLFRCKRIELEHDLLEYVFDIFLAPAEHADGLRLTVNIPPTENVVRLAILGLMSIVSIHILPGCGPGRALTRHQMCAIKYWQQQRKSKDKTGNSSDTFTLRSIMWALFVFTQCAKEQKEEGEFRQMLAEVMTRLQLVSWDDIEPMLFTFLYVPTVLAPTWRHTWEVIDGMTCATTARSSSTSVSLFDESR